MDYLSLSTPALVSACCAQADAAAWREFLRRFQRPIALSIIRVSSQFGDRRTAAIDDLVQETLLKLCADECRLLRSFSDQNEGSLLAYLRVIAANVAIDYFRAHAARKRGSGRASESLDTASEPAL